MPISSKISSSEKRAAAAATKTKKKKIKKKTFDATVPPFQLTTSSSNGDDGDLNSSFTEAIGSVAEILKSRKRIIVLAGAGMSVSCGIPDFRSPQGLYANLDVQELGLICPEDLFDFECFQDDPRPFYKFAKALYFPLGGKKRVQPSDSHRFLALLEQQGKLLRVYTQNIDGLEEVAGVSSKRMVYAHGSLRSASCLKCKVKTNFSDSLQKSIQKGEVAYCQKVKLHNNKNKINKNNKSSAVIQNHQSSTQQQQIRRVLTKRKRSTSPVEEQQHRQRIVVRKTQQRSIASSSFRSAEEENCCGGVLKPNVTFFGETLQDNVRRRLETDREKADALIVIGTSLSVAPMSKVIQYLPPNIPRILINRTIVSAPPLAKHDEDEEEPEFREKYTFDAYLLGFCDDVTRALVQETKLGGGIKRKTNIEGQLLSDVLEKKERNTTTAAVCWETTTIPNRRVLLFPGVSVPDEEPDETTTYIEVAHCDGCQEKISSKIWKC
eukprot:CAMPEP_0194152266 /NCGR_PEP_ID=MMETSP0152-20130528/51629_1 /TAXON_ID=1049557 /ORGANISM="Thalassiothrix antarctica, Strain L6-D1" /LENGTH=493 /DNA_ID=CAMNT_0038856653 /DNA_START=106 /DNA_END=1584 /DNA_ORIENTATION=-